MATLRKTAPKQQERSRATRLALLSAAIDSVAELGYTGATMDRVVARAGVSRGAQMHHFPTKSLLMQSAMTLLLDQATEDLREQTEAIRARQSDPSTVFWHLWERYFSNKLFAVMMELIIAARTDDELRAALQPVTERFHQQVDDCFYLLSRGAGYQEDRIVMALNLTMSLLRGMGLQVVLFDRPDYYKAQLDEWTKIVRHVLAPDGVAPSSSVQS